MPILFISDLHLDEKHPRITELFLSFLQKQAVTADALYILGDLFESWIGDDDHSSLSEQVTGSLAGLSKKGVPIFLMVGNRDFLCCCATLLSLIYMDNVLC